MATPIPYEFVLDYLPTGIMVKKMFGMHYIYLGKKLLLILRRQNNESDLNGVWVSTSKAHHQSLMNDVPQLGLFSIVGDERLGNWLLIPPGEEEFEEAAIKICEMISHGDPRIGRLTKKPPL
jgi:hypothetical protein